MAKALTTRQASWQGGKWCDPVRRLALYLRGGLACVYCGRGIEDGAQLSLDHLRCHRNGGGNESQNLVSCCRTCNSSRGKRSVAEFCRAVAEYLDHGITGEQILRRVRAQARRAVPMTEAREMLRRRGTLTAAIYGK
jgi:hypothetical protein